MKLKKKRHYRDIFLQIPGHLLVCSFITSVLSGLLIAFYFIPTPAKAALSIGYIQENIFAGATVITIHRVSGLLTIIFTGINLLLILPSKKISKTWIGIWQTGILLFIIFISLGITGHLLTGSKSSAYILKSILAQCQDTKSYPEALPSLFDNISLGFIRTYLMHILILPGLAGWILYNHIKKLREFHLGLQPVTIPPATLYALFVTALIIIAIIIKPMESPVSDYGENPLTQAPWIIQFMVFIKHLLSLPIAIIVFFGLFLLIWSIGYILRKLKT